MLAEVVYFSLVMYIGVWTQEHDTPLIGLTSPISHTTKSSRSFSIPHVRVTSPFHQETPYPTALDLKYVHQIHTYIYDVYTHSWIHFNGSFYFEKGCS